MGDKIIMTSIIIQRSGILFEHIMAMKNVSTVINRDNEKKTTEQKIIV